MLTPGDVVVALFSYSDMSGAKVRPALVISSKSYVAETGQVILAAISSRPVRNRFEVEVMNWGTSGLRLPSKLCMGKLTTVNVNLVKAIGHLSDTDINIAKEIAGEIILNS